MPPEIATTGPWRSIFASTYMHQHLVLVAVDEAHCIREWLVDSIVRIYFFTREVCKGWVFCFQGLIFHNLGNLRALTKAPFMALTATALPAIMQEITTSLLLRQPVTVQLGLNCPNIHLSVGKKWSVSVSCLVIRIHVYIPRKTFVA